MAWCEHTAWLQVVGDEEYQFCDGGRLAQVAKEMTNPAAQYPSCVLFIGKKQKDTAIREIFRHNNTKRGCCNGIANLRIDSTTVDSKYPILFADGDPSAQILPRQKAPTCHRTLVYPTAWKLPTRVTILDIAYSRILFLFSDVICLFSDDLGGLEQVANHLISWAIAGDASGLSKVIRPKVIVIASSNRVSCTFDLLETDDFRFHVTQGAPIDLRRSFSVITLLQLANDKLSSLARYRPLKEELLRQLDHMRQLRTHERCLFSATHLQAFYRLAVQHTAGSIHLPFSFILASRRQNQVQSDFGDHLFTFLRLSVKFKLPYDAVASFVASSIIMDSYPPGMHRFDPKEVFRTLYKPYCLKALAQSFDSGSFTEYLCKHIEHRVEALFNAVDAGRHSAAEQHPNNLKKYSAQLAQLKSNQTCLFCIRRKPEHVLNCGHAICDICVRIFGSAHRTIESHFTLSTCILCNCQTSLIVALKPVTAGVRILSVDGGGVRGVVPLEFLNLLQDCLGPECPIQDFFDLTFGTSAGGLIVLGIFLRRWTITHCIQVFDTLTRRLFGSQRFSEKAIFSRLLNIVKCWVSDGYYDVADLEASLKQCFGITKRMFDTPESSFSGSKVGVTATSISNATTFIFSNYNGEGTRKTDCGYRHLRPRDVEDEPFVWQAGRATSAAPILFRPAHISAIGTFQDGGLKHNNPIDLALWESNQIWTPQAVRDVVLSLGTGTEEDPYSPLAPHFRHCLVDGFLPRLCRSFLSSLDGEVTWKRLKNGLDEKSQPDYFRLNVPFQGQEPHMDDISSMEKLRESVRVLRDLRDYTDIAIALLVSSFYFELTQPPQSELDFYKCLGTIRCRGDPNAIIKSLTKLQQSRLEFITGSELLGYIDPVTDLCRLCHRYRKRITFYVRHPTETITLYLRTETSRCRKISGFPQSMEWFVKQQHMESPFGTVDHGCPGKLRCLGCDSDSKVRENSASKRKLDREWSSAYKMPRLR